MLSFKSIGGYLLFALVVMALFAYLLFPHQAVKAYVDGRLADIDPTLSMTAQTIRPSLPPGIKLIGVDVNRDTNPLFQIDDARISPDLAKLVKGEKQFRFEIHLADGTIAGQASVAGDPPSGHLMVEADLSQLRLDRLDAIQANRRFTLAGVLAGRMTHNGGRASRSTTSGLLTASGLRIALKAPLFGINELVMDQTDADFSISGQNLRLKSLTFNGPMLEGKITGSIELRQPVEQSRLNLTGNAKPQPDLVARLQETLPETVVNARTLGTRGITFRIRGSIDTPDVSMR